MSLFCFKKKKDFQEEVCPKIKKEVNREQMSADQVASANKYWDLLVLWEEALINAGNGKSYRTICPEFLYIYEARIGKYMYVYTFSKDENVIRHFLHVFFHINSDLSSGLHYEMLCQTLCEGNKKRSDDHRHFQAKRSVNFTWCGVCPVLILQGVI